MFDLIVGALVLFFLVKRIRANNRLAAERNARIHGRSERENCGERAVDNRLCQLPKGEYEIFAGIMLNAIDGTTTQIDQVVVSRLGVFVIETKDYSGWIFGAEDAKFWTQMHFWRYTGKQSRQFQNPIRQNWRHIYVLADALELPLHYFHNVVVFTRRCAFKTEIPKNVKSPRTVVSYIQSFDRPLLSREKVASIVSRLQQLDASVTPEKRRAHVDNLQVRFDSDRANEAYEQGLLKCPRCGAKMVERHRHSDGKKFYGCSKYPDCKGIVDPSSNRKDEPRWWF